MPAMQLSAEGVSCRRGDLALFENVEFALAAGDYLVVRGPNGCGKTTLLRALSGLSAPSAGRIRAPREEIVFAGHANALKGQLSAEENLAFWARIYGSSNAETALRAFGLHRARRTAARLLSEGQRRRLSLARLILSGRRIWIMDEPTSSLDPDSAEAFRSLVSEHCDSGGIAVAATHLPLGAGSTREIQLDLFAPAAGAGEIPWEWGGAA